MKKLKITVSLADQNFGQTNSVGVFNVATNLAKGLAVHPAVDLTVLNTHATHVQVEGARNVYFDGVTASVFRRVWWDQFGVYRHARQAEPEWLFMPKGYLSFLAKPPCKTVAYVHDLIYHEFHRQRIRGFSHFKSWYFRRCTEAAFRHATVIATNTEFTKNEMVSLIRQLGGREPRIAPIGIGFDSPRPPMEKTSQILVLVSRWPNKITPLAIDYLARWERQARYTDRIVCVGSLPAGTPLPAHWQLQERLPKEEFSRLMASSSVLVYFTRSEGFGMPPVEAVLHGTAPVFSAIPATLEVMKGVGFPFRNEDFASFQTAITEAMLCPAGTLSAWARALGEEHNWTRVVKGLLQLLSDDDSRAPSNEQRHGQPRFG